MSTIFTRAGKGSALTYAEVDSNFTNLNTDKYQSGDSATLSSLSLSTALPVASGGTGTTTSTGSGSVVLSNSPALTSPSLGVPTTADFSAGTFTWPTFNQDTTGYAAALKSPVTTGLVTIAGVGGGVTRQKAVRNANDTLLELGGSYTPTGTWNWTSVIGTWPTFNQDTTGRAGSVANSVTFDNSGTGAASGTTYNGSVAHTISYNTIGAQPAGTYVTSVAGTSPIASSGGTTPTISLSSAYGDTQNPYASKTANYILAAPNGSAGAPTFRAMVAADVPALSYVSSVSGTSGRITSTGGLTPVLYLANGVVTPGTTGSSTAIPVITVDTYGRITSITTASNPQGTVTSVAALTLGTTGTDLNSSVANSTTTPVITLNVPTASATNRGVLSSADWSSFNSKQAALISGTNIKTVSGVSLLGSGDLGTIGAQYGGTGQSAYAVGDLLYADTTTSLAKLSDVATGNALISGM